MHAYTLLAHIFLQTGLHLRSSVMCNQSYRMCLGSPGKDCIHTEQRKSERASTLKAFGTPAACVMTVPALWTTMKMT